MVSNEQSGAFPCTRRGLGGREEGGGISIATVKSPAVMFGAEIGAVSIGTT